MRPATIADTLDVEITLEGRERARADTRQSGPLAIRKRDFGRFARHRRIDKERVTKSAVHDQFPNACSMAC
jgi:hypothetical protein